MKKSPIKFSAVKRPEHLKFWEKTVKKNSLPPIDLQNAENMKQGIIERCLSLDADFNEVLVRIGEVDLTRKSIRNALCPGNWLCSEIMNAYMVLLKEREKLEALAQMHERHFFDTYFYPKIQKEVGFKHTQWTRFLTYNLFDCQNIIVPIHLANLKHWVLCVVDLKRTQILYMDSLGGEPKNVVKPIARWLDMEARSRGLQGYGFSSWPIRTPANLPS